MKGIYILFSGGYDSSFMIEKTLHVIERYEDRDNYEVNLVSVEGTFSGSKTERERKARTILLNYWKAKYHTITINHYILKIDLSSFSINTMYRPGLTQPLIWLPTFVLSLNFSRYDKILLIFTYICGDQALSFVEDMKKIIYHSVNIACIEHYETTNMDNFIYNEKCKEKLDICFPLRAEYKENIIVKLIQSDPFIFDHCTTCENYDEDDFCGECNPCIVLKSTFKNILNDERVDDSVKNKVSDKLACFKRRYNNNKVLRKAEDSDVS